MTLAGAAAQTAIKTAAGGSINTGIWTLVGLIVVALGGVITSIVKQWGPWQKNASDDRAADFARLRQDIADLKLVNTNVTARMSIAETTIVWQTVRLGQQDFVIKLMTDELEVVSPGNAVARQVRTLLDKVAPAVAAPPLATPTEANDAAAIAAAMERLHKAEA
ncbi:hypothetical protein [Sphingomonas faeni]|uniref:hypothetical protein n=1 Tax=Sphingomonas faeni TaxID=185950 RepID=UPI00334805C8